LEVSKIEILVGNFKEVINMTEDKVKDPVCGMVKPKDEMKINVIHKDVTYYFCSEEDKNMFLSNPDHWLLKR